MLRSWWLNFRNDLAFAIIIFKWQNFSYLPVIITSMSRFFKKIIGLFFAYFYKSIFNRGFGMLINSSNQASRIYQTESNTPTLITNTSTSIKNKDLADKVTISPAALNAENT